MTTRDRFDEIAERFVDVHDIYESMPKRVETITRLLAKHLRDADAAATAAERERCAGILDAEAIRRATYAGKLDRADEIHVGAQQHMASLALSEAAAAIRAQPPAITSEWLTKAFSEPDDGNAVTGGRYAKRNAMPSQDITMTDAWLANVVRDVEAMDTNEPLASRPPEATPTLASVHTAFAKLSDADQESFINSYCSGCGGPRPCHCQNDE